MLRCAHTLLLLTLLASCVDDARRATVFDVEETSLTDTSDLDQPGSHDTQVEDATPGDLDSRVDLTDLGEDATSGSDTITPDAVEIDGEFEVVQPDGNGEPEVIHLDGANDALPDAQDGALDTTLPDTVVDTLDDITDISAEADSPPDTSEPQDISNDIDTAAPTCAANPGPCCDDLTGLLRGPQYVCNPTAESDFICDGDSACGATVLKRFRPRMCSGQSSDCDGLPGPWSDSVEERICKLDERCSDSGGECITGTPECDPRNPDFCATQLDFTPCDDSVLDPRQRDICISGRCRSPGCGERSCNPAGPGHPIVTDSPDFRTSDPAGNGEQVVVDADTGLWWPKALNTSPNYTWDQALVYCADLQFAGNDDWRLADCYEISTIVDWWRTKPALNPSVFLGAPNMWAWTSCFSEQSWAFALNPGRGDIGPLLTDTKEYAWCVRGESHAVFGPQSPRFAQEGAAAGILRDNATGLLWQRVDDGVKRSWLEATSYCPDLTLEGVANWRLPHIDELWSIVDANRDPAGGNNPTLDLAFGHQPNDWYWSSTAHFNPPSTGSAWSVHFGTASREPKNKDSGFLARCVADP